MPGQVILHDAARQTWLAFTHPLEIIRVINVNEVSAAVQHLAQRVENEGLHAAGFISYEASPAFDAALQTHPAGRLPLIWFGLYRSPHSIQLPVAAPAPYSLEWTSSMTYNDYAHSIEHIKQHIALGDTYQVNFTLRLQAPFHGDAWQLFLQLQQAQRAHYGAYLDLGDFQICSASPELFFRLDGERITARPMKGTAARGLSPEQDAANAAWLAASEKNRAENVMIVDMLRNDLGRIASTGSVHVPQLFELECYPTVWQMTSTVTAKTTASLPEILRALFPCASITGAPKPRTMQIIRQLEATPRQVYTGCIGFFSPGRQAQFNVAIRTVLVDCQARYALYGVGGGIVWDSSIKEEYVECQIKARLLGNVSKSNPLPRPEQIEIQAAPDLQADFNLLESLLWTSEDGWVLLEEHIQRLSTSAAYFNYPCSLPEVRLALEKLAASLPAEAHKVRLTLDAQGCVAVQAIPLSRTPYPEVVRLRLAPAPISSQDLFLYHKTTHRQVYEQALSDARQAGPCDDVLLWNERGEVTETSSANLLCLLDGRWVTPPVSCGLLAGTARAARLAAGKVSEQILLLSDLERASELRVVNSVRGERRAELLKL